MWEAFLATRGTGERNTLAEHYLPLVRYVASKMPSNSISSVELDDLVSYGTFGLLDAIGKFDPDKGVKFETYAITRIKGAIIDEIRSIDWVPRSIRAKAREIERAQVELEARLGRPPREEEMATHLQIPLPEMHVMLGQTTITMVNIEEGSDDPDRMSERDTLADAAADPEQQFLAGEVGEMLIDALLDLPERLKILMALTYVHDMTLAEIGRVLGVTESRVSQLQSRMLKALRESMSRELSMASPLACALTPTASAA